MDVTVNSKTRAYLFAHIHCRSDLDGPAARFGHGYSQRFGCCRVCGAYVDLRGLSVAFDALWGGVCQSDRLFGDRFWRHLVDDPAW